MSYRNLNEKIQKDKERMKERDGGGEKKTVTAKRLTKLFKYNL